MKFSKEFFANLLAVSFLDIEDKELANDIIDIIVEVYNSKEIKLVQRETLNITINILSDPEEEHVVIDLMQNVGGYDREFSCKIHISDDYENHDKPCVFYEGNWIEKMHFDEFNSVERQFENLKKVHC